MARTSRKAPPRQRRGSGDRSIMHDAIGGAAVGALLFASVAAAVLQIDSNDPRPLLNLGPVLLRVGYYGAIGALVGMVVSLVFRRWRRFVLMLWGAAVGAVSGVCISQVGFPGNTYLGNQIHFAVITVPLASFLCIVGAWAGLWLANYPTRKAQQERRNEVMRRVRPGRV